MKRLKKILEEALEEADYTPDPEALKKHGLRLKSFKAPPAAKIKLDLTVDDALLLSDTLTVFDSSIDNKSTHGFDDEAFKWLHAYISEAAFNGESISHDELKDYNADKQLILYLDLINKGKFSNLYGPITLNKLKGFANRFGIQ